MADQSKSQHNNDQKSPGIPAIEWVIAIIGLIIVVGTVGYLLVEAIGGDESPPDLTFTVTQITERTNGYLVEFSALNQGGRTASAVVIEGQLLDGETTVETSSVEIDYVPAGSERRAGLFFTHEPDAYTLVIRPLGFQEP